jgi:hypothetical protein
MTANGKVEVDTDPGSSTAAASEETDRLPACNVITARAYTLRF